MQFTWNQKDLNIFPDRMQNLQGVQLAVLFGGAEPGVTLIENVNGNTIIVGYVGHIFNTLARKHNARFDISNVNNSIEPYAIHLLILNETVDISGTDIILSNFSIEWYSYPFTMLDWCVMLPVEPTIPIYKVFAFAFQWEAFVLTIVVFFLISVLLTIISNFSGIYRDFCVSDFFFNIDCFRGMLGQSFSVATNTFYSTKIVYLLIFLLGIIIVTSYDAFLQSFMTQPPRENMIKSFYDLQSCGLKIYLADDEINTLYITRPDFMENYSNVFQGETNFVRLKQFRDSLNTKYAFACNWARISECDEICGRSDAEKNECCRAHGQAFHANCHGGMNCYQR
ncbi:uncharacterized protein LOC129909404 [Episyrphus balteatus]|uniref:uncharacterized protein LOC129909404 n=1 Tax=Episyrphus balteatus TaxID=286459 RepID=UPI00248518F3|nr:uncharacterized protein LOC129909404 [Episyrphus balteatus]